MEAIIFLDIDGVINPHRYTTMPKAKKTLVWRQALWKRNPDIKSLPAFTVNQVTNYFDQKACGYIRSLCQEFSAKIVISSSWRMVFEDKKLKAILDIQSLGFAFQGSTCIGTNRPQEIQDYIAKHQITQYIVIDDFNMAAFFGSHFILTKERMEEEQYLAARNSLRRQCHG